MVAIESSVLVEDKKRCKDLGVKTGQICKPVVLSRLFLKVVTK